MAQDIRQDTRHGRKANLDARPETAAEARSEAVLAYQSGFGNQFSTEAVAGALPIGRNSPQRPPLGLYAELISGTAFTAARRENRRTWPYRIRPSVVHSPIAASTTARCARRRSTTPRRRRRGCAGARSRFPTRPTDFIDGIVTVGGNGSAADQSGMAVHVYAANRSMTERFFYNADGEMLVVPQQGRAAVRHRARRPRGGATARSRSSRAACASASSCRTDRRAATSARIRRRCCGCPTSVRSAPTASPTRATSSRRRPPTRQREAALRPGRRSSRAACGRPNDALAARCRRLARQSTRPTSTTSSRFNGDRHRSASTIPIPRSSAC